MSATSRRAKKRKGEQAPLLPIKTPHFANV